MFKNVNMDINIKYISIHLCLVYIDRIDEQSIFVSYFFREVNPYVLCVSYIFFTYLTY